MAYGSVPLDRAEVEGRIVRRAWSDPAFRQLLLEDPRAAFEAELGIRLPERLQVQVVEEGPDQLCLVLPVNLSGISPTAVLAMTGHGRHAGSAARGTGGTGGTGRP